MTNEQGQAPFPPTPYGTPAGGHGFVPPPRKRGKGPTFWLLAIGIPLALLFGCTALVATSGSQTTSAAPDESRPAASKKAESGDKENKATAPGIGKVVKDGKFSFKVTKLGKAAKVGNEFLNKEAQGQFVLVYVTVKNIGDEAQDFAGSAQKLHDSKGREYESDAEAAIYLGDSKSLYEKINPGNSVKGIVLFDVPPGTKVASIELHDSIFSDGATVSLT